MTRANCLPACHGVTAGHALACPNAPAVSPTGTTAIIPARIFCVAHNVENCGCLYTPRSTGEKISFTVRETTPQDDGQAFPVILPAAGVSHSPDYVAPGLVTRTLPPGEWHVTLPEHRAEIDRLTAELADERADADALADALEGLLAVADGDESTTAAATMDAVIATRTAIAAHAERRKP